MSKSERIAQPFLDYAIEQCKIGKTTESAINFDEKLLKIAKFYKRPFYSNSPIEGVIDVFENFTTNLDIHFYVLPKTKQINPIITIDDVIRRYQLHGIELIWREEIFEKYLS